MLKLLMVSAAIIPVAIFPWMDTAPKSEPARAEVTSETFPAASRLSHCKDVEMSIYFNDAYITMSSAEYVLDTIQSLNKCSSVEFEIVPLIEEGAASADVTRSLAQTQELQDYLAVIGYEAPVSAEYAKNDHKAGNNWRGALLRISASGTRRS